MHRHFTTKLLKIQEHRCQKIQPKSRGFPRSFRCSWSFLTYPGPACMTTIRTWILYGILQVQEYVLPRKHELASIYTFGVLQIYFWPSCTQPFLSVLAKNLLNAWRSTTNVRSWTVLPRINKVLHTDSLVCRIDWCQTRNKTRHYCWNFWQKSLWNCVAVGDMSQWRVHLAQTKILNKKGQ